MLTALQLVLAIAGLLPPQVDDDKAPDVRAWSLPSGRVVELRPNGDGNVYTVTEASGALLTERRVAPDLHLRFATFDPAQGEPPRVLQIASDALHIVQFQTRVLPEYVAELEQRGVEVHRFLPSQGLIVSAPVAVIERLAQLPFVRWTGEYRADYRVDSALLQDPAAGPGDRERPLASDERTIIQVVRRGAADKRRVAAAIERLGGTTEGIAPNGFLLRARFPRAALPRVAALDDVLWIERAGELEYFMDNVRSDGGADVLESVTGLTGQGVHGEVIDTGLNAGHPDFGPVLSPTGLINDCFFGLQHGTSVAGIAFGRGLGDPTARGVLPDGQLVFTVYNQPFELDPYPHFETVLQPPYQIVFQSRSYDIGYAVPSYPSTAFEMDDLVHRYDLLITQAIGNTAGMIALRANAKNVVSVGGIAHFDTLDLADDAYAGVSVGPAEDGRIKPDLSYWHDQIKTTAACGGYDPDFTGTSAATPAVAGYFGLAFQLWFEERLGNVAPGPSVFAARPKSATARALVANAADAYAFQGQTHDLNRMHQGWGRPDVQALMESGGRRLVIDETDPLQNLESRSYSVQVESGQDALRATLVYTDLPGTSSSTQHRINDLSLRLVSPTGKTYWGNHGLLEGNESSEGGAADTINTTEQVWITQPEAGTWSVHVSADEVVLDAHVETAVVDQDYALVVAPVRPVWTDLGGAAGGAFGEPELTARGFFTPNAPFRIDLDHGAPNAPAVVLFRGLSLPFLPVQLGAVGQPSIVSSASISSTNAAGELSVRGTFPAGLPSGSTFEVQVYLTDPTGPSGLSASNAIGVVTP